MCRLTPSVFLSELDGLSERFGLASCKSHNSSSGVTVKTQSESSGIFSEIVVLDALCSDYSNRSENDTFVFFWAYCSKLSTGISTLVN